MSYRAHLSGRLRSLFNWANRSGQRFIAAPLTRLSMRAVGWFEGMLRVPSGCRSGRVDRTMHWRTMVSVPGVSCRVGRRPDVRRFACCGALEPHVLLAMVLWDGGGHGANWQDPQIWSADACPLPAKRW